MGWREEPAGTIDELETGFGRTQRERDVSERKNCEKCRLEEKEENSMAGGVVTEG